MLTSVAEYYSVYRLSFIYRRNQGIVFLCLPSVKKFFEKGIVDFSQEHYNTPIPFAYGEWK